MAHVRFESVTKVFNKVVATDDVSLEVADGEFVVLLGPSGCGKTTLLRCLAGLEKVDAGRIFIGDRNVTDLAPGRRRIRARIGGLHCSLCTGTIEKALGRRPGVEKVSVSLTHEQALIEFDPTRARAEDLLQILKDIGYTVSDPRKVRPC